MNKKLVIILIIIAVVILGIVGVFIVNGQGSAFTQEKWQNMQQREAIVDNLIDSKKLIGMSEQQVKDFLGDEYISADGKWMYITTYQPEGVYLQVLERLYIEFENGVVSNCYTKTH